MSDEEKIEQANTMGYAKRIHKNTQTRIKVEDNVRVRVKKKGYLSLKEFIRKHKARFINPQGKLKEIIEGANVRED